MIDPQGPSGGGGLGEIPYLRLPQPEALFARRAARFAALAPGDTLSDYLELLAKMAGAQEAACAARRDIAGTARREPVSARGEPVEPRPPLDVTTHRRDARWREALGVIVSKLSAADTPSETRRALERLATAAPDTIELLADRVLANAAEGSDLAAGPFVAAALQVYFTGLAALITPADVPRARRGCPMCGSLPVVGVVLGDDRLRYLVCSVCGTQWHRTRIQCTACGESKDLAYYRLEGERAASVSTASALKAEACPTCKAYTKLFYVERDPRLEPFADDMATLALDLLMAENGWARHGVNLFLIPANDLNR